MTLTEYPDCLSAKELLFSKHFEMFSHPLLAAVKKLLYASDYAERQIAVLKMLLQEDDCQIALKKEHYQHLIAQIPLSLSPTAFAKALRLFRHRHLLRLLLREYAHLADTRSTMEGWSNCADTIITHSLSFCERQLTDSFGYPCPSNGNPTQLYVLAMGKLGGNELNFSSDIDLIFAFSENGYTTGTESISHQQYYTKVIQQWMQLIQNTTVDGFVFRIDLRLRPNGDSGPLVLSFSAMETYYQEQGRDWERYAMVKARLIDANDDGQQWFNQLMKPFVYRRYIDFSVIESMRSMKSMIEREVKLNAMLNDIKRGSGGIREVEFIIQSFQLIRGGRLPDIQHQNALKALSALKKAGLLTRAVVLKKAYLFLRQLENALQTLNDKQTHSVVLTTTKQAQITIAMGYSSWLSLEEMLHRYQRIISHAFQSVLVNQGNEYKDDQRLLVSQLTSLWQGHVESSMAVNLLSSLNYQHAERCYQMLYSFRHSPRCRRLSQTARMRLDRFMVLLLNALMMIPETDKVLLQVLKLLENIVGRSAYLALLTENPLVLNEVLHWFLHSPFITSLIVTHPFLLEVFIDQDKLWRPLSKKQLKEILDAKLLHAHDVEHQDDVFRQFKLTCSLLAARAELHEQFNSVRMSKFLTDVAEVIITTLLTTVLKQAEFIKIKSKFAIIAYGTLGSFEMNYNSDVDLVFLHTLSTEQEYLAVRLTQKILHRLTTRTQSGVLYSVDTRLRPSGTAGLLISHVDAYVDYQRQSAWTWEHQALLHARIIFAPLPTRSLFLKMKEAILLLTRDKSLLKDEILAMREKMSKHLTVDATKHLPGGLIDLKFLVQFLVLAHPSEQFLRCTHPLAQIKQLLLLSVLTKHECAQLNKAYHRYQDALHKAVLEETTCPIEAHQTQVLAISHRFYS